jgi:hypothetical protein
VSAVVRGGRLGPVSFWSRRTRTRAMLAGAGQRSRTSWFRPAQSYLTMITMIPVSRSTLRPFPLPHDAIGADRKGADRIGIAVETSASPAGPPVARLADTCVIRLRGPSRHDVVDDTQHHAEDQVPDQAHDLVLADGEHHLRHAQP